MAGFEDARAVVRNMRELLAVVNDIRLSHGGMQRVGAAGNYMGINNAAIRMREIATENGLIDDVALRRIMERIEENLRNERHLPVATVDNQAAINLLRGRTTALLNEMVEGLEAGIAEQRLIFGQGGGARPGVMAYGRARAAAPAPAAAPARDLGLKTAILMGAMCSVVAAIASDMGLTQEAVALRSAVKETLTDSIMRPIWEAGMPKHYNDMPNDYYTDSTTQPTPVSISKSKSKSKFVSEDTTKSVTPDTVKAANSRRPGPRSGTR